MRKYNYMYKPVQDRSSAFTLVEILVAVSIIGILLTFSFAGLQSSRSSSRDAQRKTDIEDIRSGLEMYRSDCGTYPDGPLLWDQVLVGTGVGNCAATNTYMTKVPQDPQNAAKNTTYEYVKSANGYTICAFLEHSTANPVPCAGLASQNCGTTGCNYSKTNP